MNMICTECGGMVKQTLYTEFYDKDKEKIYMQCECGAEYPIMYRCSKMREYIAQRRSIPFYTSESNKLKQKIDKLNRINKEIYNGLEG